MTEAAATAGPPPTVDAQDPLPEGAWLWRRVFVFGVTVILLALVWAKIDAVSDVARNGSETAIAGLVKLLRLCLILIGALILFYLLAPSAEQLTRLIQTARTLRSGVAIRTQQTATAPDGSTATARSEAGPAPLPPAQMADTDEPSPAFELPGNVPGYVGPPLEDAPPVAPDVPEEAPWQKP